VTPAPAYRVIGRVLGGQAQVLLDGHAWSGGDGWHHFVE
jgi:hypothetical protein